MTFLSLLFSLREILSLFLFYISRFSQKLESLNLTCKYTTIKKNAAVALTLGHKHGPQTLLNIQTVSYVTTVDDIEQS